MVEGAAKSPRKEAIRLSKLLEISLGADRFPVDVASLAREISRNYGDPIDKIVGDELPGFEGMLRPHKKRPAWHIVYSTNPQYRGRERFTIAHEFGHYMLHRPELSAADYRDGLLTKECGFECLPLQSNEWKQAEREREEEADTFASYLLMPIDDYRVQVGRNEMSRELLAHITRRYGVSLLAAVRKWIEFTDTRAAMVVAYDGYARWGRASDTALKTGIFIPSGMPIPEASVAGMGPSALKDQDRAVQLPAGIWTFRRGSEPVRELTIFSERLGLSVTLLMFDRAPFGVSLAEEHIPDTYDQFVQSGQV
ncbi:MULTISPECIES: ImmA/IrrE family metallo-endopeptidase [Hyphomicrobiales]|uniref:ImmA/IrrE family metallo-endopeptidase n=2 Tax=Hyphomicrobiales TaxID=356 RepID=A0ABW0F964_9HYPH|nr:MULTISPECIES: ImmA/IrrE family metallo-endopeptidase [Hyphomicrobiales]MCT4494531.1 ImmA/IrrE family metallo-endopeptidase [Bosea minatitlanensis]TSJ64158.1 ImmA/IrrE family metallo-endopeptidase [Ancylobacter moscoviensis]